MQNWRRWSVFLLTDYAACCAEEEELLRNVCLEKRKRFAVPENSFVHFDIPMTVEHETELLYAAGFADVKAVDCINGATLFVTKKDGEKSR
ncbi:MAG: hypothetical protein Q4C58_14720 [Eubacteriales bacterium]|nr:hypothetical protein [Eubacteriales bacterium]